MKGDKTVNVASYITISVESHDLCNISILYEQVL